MLSPQTPQTQQATETLQLLLQVLTDPKLFKAKLAEFAAAADEVRAATKELTAKDEAASAKEASAIEALDKAQALVAALEKNQTAFEKEKATFKETSVAKVLELNDWNAMLSEKEKALTQVEESLKNKEAACATAVAAASERFKQATTTLEKAEAMQVEYEEKLAKLRSLV
jgi:chromosome segregation ATPase